MKLLLSSILITVPLIGCGEQVLDKQENSSPTILIVSHSDGVQVQDGYTESFRATVSDDDNEFSELQVAWYVGEEIVCDWTEASPAGDSNCAIVFEEGDTNVIVEVRDPQGTGGRAEVSVSVLPTAAPVVELYSPISGENYYSDQLIQFWAVVSDVEDSAEELIVTWTSNIDGELSLDTAVDSSGEMSDYTYLSEGQHAIEVRVEDSSGKTSTEEVVVRVGGENTIPICAISEPLDSSSFVIGEAIQFRGSALDDDIPANQLSVEWESDKDGIFGNSTPSTSGNVSFATASLTTDIHTITMRVTDEVGAVCAEQIVVSVGNTPTATIENPLDGEVFSVGEAIVFRGFVSDQEDLANQISVTWTSSLDGVLEAGAANSQGITQFSSSSLVAGVHSINLSAVDTAGLSADDLITFRINTPPEVSSLSFSPDPVYGDDSLSAVALSADADGDSVNLSYQWYENGVITSFTGSIISPSELDAGELWTVRVTPDDSYVSGAYEELSIMITNSLPQVSNVSISPSNTVYNDDILTCSAAVFDADESLIPNYNWNVDGTIYTGASLDLSNVSVMPNDQISCMVSVTDSLGEIASGTASVVLDNREPVINSISIVSSSQGGQTYTNSTLTCTTSISDADGEILTLSESFSWKISGVQVGTGNSLVLDPSFSSPSDVVECFVAVEDGFGGADTGNFSVPIQNTAPVVDSFHFTPSEPNVSDVLLCEATASDVDGATPALGFSFSNLTTGATYFPTVTTTDSASLDVSTLNIIAGDEIECLITATDSNGGTAIASKILTIINTAPVISNLQITPNTGVVVGTDLVCSATAYDYNDGDITNHLTYQWSVNGLPVVNGDTYTANATDADVWDMIVCTAYVMDADLEITNDVISVQMENTVPVLSNLQITGGSGSYYNDEELTCSAVLTDPDEFLTPSYIWMSGSTVLGTSDILDLGTTSVLPSDPLTCIVNANDSHGGVDNDSILIPIGDRAPETPIVNITWASGNSQPEETEDLNCMAAGGEDPDGETHTYSYAWTSDLGSSAIGDTLSSALTQLSETWTCEVTSTAGALGTTGTDSVTIDSGWDGEREFTNCTQTGRYGPDQAQCNITYTGTTLEGEVTVSGGIQAWTVPSTGTYIIEAWGARGGEKMDSYTATGGNGALMSGEFTLTEGEVLYILVGQKGGNPNGYNTSGGCGGGGGTFVYYDANDSYPLIAAAGGGGCGAANENRAHGLSGLTTTSGGTEDGTAGTGGNGGSTGLASYNSGGGAGWLSNGQNSSYSPVAGGGQAPRNGGDGGNGGRSSYSAIGGFGGGGGTNDGGGGGGGFSGGGAGSYSPIKAGGGGGSYNAGINQNNVAGYNPDHGRVFIDKL